MLPEQVTNDWPLPPSRPADPRPTTCPLQCEQTANGTGCTVVGNCGKTPEVSAGFDTDVDTWAPVTPET
eukprot:248183-Chlamydomonas_euryale.AAC.4